MIQRNCAVCDKVFNTYPCKIRVGRGKYCGRECSLKITGLDGIKGAKTRFNKNQVPHNFKGWRLSQSRKNGRVYKEIYSPNHPNATKAGYVKEHRLVMEKVLGRYLESHEVVDHINRFETLNNNPSNLRLMTKVAHDRMNTPLNIHRRWEERKLQSVN